MLKILNRDYKQSFDAIEEEFEHCHVLVRLDDVMDEEGYLVAVSEEPDTHAALCDVRKDYPLGTIFYLGGLYKNGTAISVQSVVAV